MAITAAVVDLSQDHEFRQFVRLNFVTVADDILGGNFPSNITKAEEKNRVTEYARDVFRGQVNLNVWVDAVLAQNAMQTLINAEPPGDYLGALKLQAAKQYKALAGIIPVYE